LKKTIVEMEMMQIAESILKVGKRVSARVRHESGQVYEVRKKCEQNRPFLLRQKIAAEDKS